MKKVIQVVGAVIEENGLILCAKRGNTKTLANLWEFPGGKIEKGETPQEALSREITEEMGCQVVIGELVETTKHEYDFGIVDLTTFKCTLLKGRPTLTEHAEIRWLEPRELLSVEWAPADIPAVKKLMRVDAI